jgi:iron complex transport system substrate-binding protein
MKTFKFKYAFLAFFMLLTISVNAEIPKRVVSLSPSVTEAIIAIGAGEKLVGTTYHCTLPPEVAEKEIIGGFFNPCVKKIVDLEPDMIFIANMHLKIQKELDKSGAKIVQIDDVSIEGFYKTMKKLGVIFNKKKEAQSVIDKVKKELDHISKKTVNIPESKRIRAIRIVGRDKVMVPGDDTFHNEYIRAAGGIPAKFGVKKGIFEVSLKQWKNFNPQFIFYCGGDKEIVDKYFNKPGWKDVDAVKNGKVVGFPCDLTCRVSTNTGYFTQWLSASMYSDKFFKNEQVVKDKIISKKALDIKLSYIKSAQVLELSLYDFLNTGTLIEFKKPQKIISTLEGPRNDITTIGNYYSPPPCWGIIHSGIEPIKKRFCNAAKLNPEKTSLLYTGADTRNTSIQFEEFKEMKVYALVTAGVSSNAIRTSKDTGTYYEPGTINIILMTNMKLSSQAMTRAIITATEAKTAAMQDLDIRSSYQPQLQATGTGTDNIIVVQGEGKNITYTGGHTKMGELIAKTVYKGVKEAVYLQNGFTENLNIFQKLKKRNIEIFPLSKWIEQNEKKRAFELAAEFEKLMLRKDYASFMESVFAISDDYESGIITDLTVFEKWCDAVSEDIAGKKIQKKKVFIKDKTSTVLEKAINAILNGLSQRKK